MAFKKTVVFDFDGVVHSYKSGWKGVTTIPDEPVDGIKEVIDELRQDYYVLILSTRCFQDGGVEAIMNWLDKYNIEVDDVIGEKPPAIVYVDDRALRFDGKTKGLVEQIRSFRNWIEESNDSENLGDEEKQVKYQIGRAKKYLEDHMSKDGSESSLEYCIISDLLRIINKK